MIYFCRLVRSMHRSNGNMTRISIIHSFTITFTTILFFLFLSKQEATEMAAETPEKQKFINVLNGHVMNEVQQLGEASMGGPPSGEDVTEEMKEAWQKAKKLLKFMAPKLKISHMLKSKGWKDEQIENLLGPLDEIK